MNKDLFPGPINYVEKDYKKFIKEICEDKPLTKHKGLERYREDIKLLFQKYDIEYLVELDEYNTVYSWMHAVDDAVFIATHLKGRKLSEKTIDAILDRYDPTSFQLTRLLSVIYCPEEMIKSFSEYIWYAADIFFCGTFSLYEDDKIETIDVDNQFLNELYNYEYQLYLNNDEKERKLLEHERFIALVIAYLYLNNKFSIEWFDNFIDNLDEYFNQLVPQTDKKIELDDIEHIWGGGYDLPTEHPIYREIFNNLDNLTIKRNKVISKNLKTRNN